MAGEATVVCSVQVSKGGLSINSVGTTSPASKIYDMDGTYGASENQNIGTSDEALTLPAGLSAPGYELMVYNADATNYVELSYASGGSFAASVFEKLMPGDKYLGHPSSTTVYAKANTAACDVIKTSYQKHT